MSAVPVQSKAIGPQPSRLHEQPADRMSAVPVNVRGPSAKHRLWTAAVWTAAVPAAWVLDRSGPRCIEFGPQRFPLHEFRTAAVPAASDNTSGQNVCAPSEEQNLGAQPPWTAAVPAASENTSGKNVRAPSVKHRFWTAAVPAA